MAVGQYETLAFILLGGGIAIGSKLFWDWYYSKRRKP